MKNRRNNLFSVWLFLAALLLCGCSGEHANDKVTVVATLFPQYDFARQIAGEYADVVLLLPPGMESHSFDPKPSDMVTISKSDVFIYTGEYMESWAHTIVESLGDKTVVVDASHGIELVREEHFGVEHDHDHEHDNYADEDHHDHDREPGGHIHEFDPHIWTSPVYAMKMVDNIVRGLCEADEAHADYYMSNAKKYKEELSKLDEDFRQFSQGLSERTLFFGGRFAMTYFVREYGFDCISAYPDCSAESEPSIQAVMEIIEEIKWHGAKAVYYEELTDPKVARTIAEETGVKLLLLHSAHNVSKEDFDSGVTYIDLMRQNLANLKEGMD